MMLGGCRGKPATNKHRMNQELSYFATHLRELISHRESVIDDQQFSALALELFALQFENNPVYRKICETRGSTPSAIKHWAQIPSVPTATFKDLDLTSLAPDERTAIFHSSGTTEQKPSRHFHSVESLAVYDASLWRWFEQNLLANLEFRIQNSELIYLTPPPEKVPHSSLVHMFEIVGNKIDGVSASVSRSHFFGEVDKDNSWALDFNGVVAAMGENSKLKTQNSKLIFGTAFSFVHLLDYLAENNLKFQLPPYSRVMETGGYKNRSRSMPKAELHALITERLGVPRENIICEYGMSELSSQAYDSKILNSEFRIQNENRAFYFPNWARVQIISPETGHEVAEGETGLIRIFDLANVFSVAAIQTEDLGVRRGDGFELLGRAQSAEPRGCSLMTI
jgi:hypothetical protein